MCANDLCNLGSCVCVWALANSCWCSSSFCSTAASLVWCLASTLKKKSKGIVMNHALLSSSVEFSCVWRWKMVTLAFHRCSSPYQREAAAAMPEYFSKLLMGFRLTTKADAACIVTLTQPEMKLHPYLRTTKLFQSFHGEDKNWRQKMVNESCFNKKSLFVFLLHINVTKITFFRGKFVK